LGLNALDVKANFARSVDVGSVLKKERGKGHKKEATCWLNQIDAGEVQLNWPYIEEEMQER